MQSRNGRPTKCFKRFHQAPMWNLVGCFNASGSFVKVHVNGHCCTWACVCLKCLHLCSAVGWLCVALGWRDSSPLLKCRGFVNNSRENFGGRGIAGLPSSSQLQRAHLRRRCVPLEEEGLHTGLPLHNGRKRERLSSSQNEEQVLLLTMSVSACSSCFVLS